MRTKNVGLITEINRMRNMMGLRLLTEAIDPSDIIKKSLDVFGVSKGLVDDIQVKIDMSDTLLKNTTDMVKAKLARAGYSDIANVSDDILRGILKNEPNFKTALSKAFEKAVKSKTEELAQNITIPGVADLVTKFKDVIPKPSDDVDTLDLYKGILDDINTELVKLADDITAGRVRGVTSVPKDLTDMIDFFKKTSDDVGAMKTAKTASTITPTPKSTSVLDDELAKAQKNAEMDKTIKDIGDYMRTGDWSKLGWSPEFINPYKKEMISWFNLKIADLKSGKITKESLMSGVKDELEIVVKKKQLKDLTPNQRKAGSWLLRSLKGEAGGFWSSPAGIGILIGLGFALYYGYAVVFLTDVYENNKNKINEELSKSEFTQEEAQKYFKDNGYTEDVTGVTPQEDGTVKVSWKSETENGVATFKQNDEGQWVPQ